MEKQQQQQRSTAISDKVLFSDRMLGLVVSNSRKNATKKTHHYSQSASRDQPLSTSKSNCCASMQRNATMQCRTHLETTPIFAGNIFNCIGGRVVFNRSGIVSSTTISSVLGMPCSR
ncbi:hypothetical protein Tsp_02988 [Trichinella spiralis]|uniref:hypothetical protein n=1 Tax=Trichinella spiralis TaxID=6334 RepID=UPI0001EFB208|nr:hypothetical protein Tsp_02988 [Trichinella spiralis]